MGEKTSISWTDVTWNIARGCTKVNASCKFCYMMRDGEKYGYNGKEVVRTKTVFNLPLKLESGLRVFTSSLTDIFHEQIDSFRDEMWAIIRRRPDLTFQLLTKRWDRIIDQLPPDWGTGWPNVWIGVSAGCQEEFNEAMPALIRVPAAVRWMSLEPLHGGIDISSWIGYIYNYEENNRNNQNIQSGFGSGVGNSSEWRNLEDSQTGLGQVVEKGGDQAVFKSEGRKRRRRILNDPDNVSKQENLYRRPSLSLFPLQGGNPDRDDDQSRRWAQEKQSPGQLRSDDRSRTGDTCSKNTEKGEVGSGGGEELYVKIDGDSSQGNNKPTTSWGKTEFNSKGLRDQISTRVETLQKTTVGSSFWIVTGGESGNDKGKWRYRPCKLEWIESIVAQCQNAGVPVFVKQLGTHLAKQLKLHHRHGADMSEWPTNLQVQEFPT